MHIVHDTAMVIDDFVSGFRETQRFNGRVKDQSHQGVRYLTFENGRRLSRFTHEFFVQGTEPRTAISLARQIDPLGNHFISVLGEAGLRQLSSYRAAGYVHSGIETIMVRDLTDGLPDRSDVEVRKIASLEEGTRIHEAQRAAGLDGHPVTAAHLQAPDLVQRWIAVDGAPAAFGRIVVLGDAVYLSDVVTLPMFRRRRLADALIRQLLLDARDRGANRCVLTSTAMATQLYAGLGFAAALPLIGFETP